MGILQHFREIPTSKNLIRVWPNESGSNIFNVSDRPVRLLQIFIDKLSHGYNVEVLRKNFVYEPVSKIFVVKISS